MQEKISLGPKRIVALVLLAVTVVYAVVSLLPVSDNFGGENPTMKKTDLPLLIAHGGGNREFPDNTLEAFYNAYSVSLDVMMETDVSITKDGVVILSHDTTIDRKTNETGAIADWNYTDLIAQRVDFGYTNPTKNEMLNGDRVKFTTADGKNVTPLDVKYPEGVAPRDNEIFFATTLEELLVAFPNNLINVEIKQEGDTGIRCLDAIIDLLEKYDAYGRVVLASFHDGIYNEFCRRKDAGELPASFMYSPGIGGVAKYYLLTTTGLDVFFRDGIAVFQLPTSEFGINLATKRLVKNAHAHNVAVHYWTVNDKEEMRELIEIGADGIMTDYPHRLAEVYAEYTK